MVQMGKADCEPTEGMGRLVEWPVVRGGHLKMQEGD
jgi:hypothetical protein